MLYKIKVQLLKLYVNLLISADRNSDETTRFLSFSRSLLVFAPAAFLLDLLGVWFDENQTFTLFTAAFVAANAFIGGIAHKIKGDFNWEKFLVKTLKMTGIICFTYIVLEGLVSPIGNNVITDGLIASFQVATLLYPGAKILKNIFIWSDGEHPPKWIMQKVYNFKENGDLKAFLNQEGAGDLEVKKKVDNETI